MDLTYRLNYIKIYFWQGAAFILRFLSMFIVTPFLTKEPNVFGIYAICMSITIFLNYADLGFLRAGQKFAAESFAQGDRISEMRVIGFGTFILLTFTIICSAIFIYIAFFPYILIKGLDSVENLQTASNLLFILALSAPITILQRMGSLIFEIRLDNYITQRISLIGSIVIIGSVFYFFRNGRYEIVPYFLFSQIINFFVVITFLFLAKKKYNYNIPGLLKYMRFDKEIYNKTKSLAYSGLYIMIVWIIFYELDQIIIGKFLGVQKVAIYAVAFAFSSFFRTIFGILYSPFTSRANHYVGIGNDDGLKRFIMELFFLSAPVIMLSTIAFSLTIKPLILCWVGESYYESIEIARLLILSFSLSFISYTASIVLLAKMRINETYIINTIQPVVYWIGVLLSYSYFGLFSFAFFKFLAIISSEIFFLYIILNYLNITIKDLFQKLVWPLLIPILFLITSLLFSDLFLPSSKSKFNLFIVFFVTGTSLLGSLVLLYFTSSFFRTAGMKMIKIFYK